MKQYYQANAVTFPITTTDPSTVREAMNSTDPEALMWRKAIETELNTLVQKKTWIPEGKIQGTKSSYKAQSIDRDTVLPSHIVLKIKRNEHGHPEKCKARVVAGGNHQIKGRDFESVYALVVDTTLALIGIAMSMKTGLSTRQVDVKAAFLNGDIDRRVLVSHLSNLPPDMQNNTYYKLTKALYGLHQAPLRWFQKIREVLTEKLGFKQLHSDGAVFLMKKVKNGQISIAIALVYVDDILFICNSESLAQNTACSFLEIFEGENKGVVKWYLGFISNVMIAMSRSVKSRTPDKF